MTPANSSLCFSTISEVTDKLLKGAIKISDSIDLGSPAESALAKGKGYRSIAFILIKA